MGEWINMTQKYHKAASLTIICALLLAILTACGSAAPRSSEANASPNAGTGAPTETSAATEPDVSAPQPSELSLQQYNIVISELIGEIYVTGWPYTIRLLASEVLDYPGSSGTKAYRDILLHVFGNGKDETISLNTNGTDYVDPELSLVDFTADGIPDIFVKLPVAGSTRPSVRCYIYSCYNGRLREILNPEHLTSLLTYTVTYYDNYMFGYT